MGKRKNKQEWEIWNDRALAVAADAEELVGKKRGAERLRSGMEDLSDKLCITKYVADADRRAVERGEAERDDMLGIPRPRTEEERREDAA